MKALWCCHSWAQDDLCPTAPCEQALASLCDGRHHDQLELLRIAQGITRLAETGDAHQCLAEATKRIHAQLTDLQAAMGPVSGLMLDEHGQFHLTPIEANVPEQGKALSRRLYWMLPRPDLPNLFREVND